MYNIVKEAHSGIAYIVKEAHSVIAYLVLIALVIAVINAIIGATSKKEFTKKDRTISLVAFILTHIQLLAGLILYFVSPLGLGQLGNMKDSAMRLTSMEHPLINIIAIVLITMGWSQHKKAADDKKFGKIALFYGIGLVLVLSRIPYGSWFA